MRKTKEYSSDVQQKIVELYKIENGYKKKANALKIPISTIRAIIKKFQSTKDVTNLPGRGRIKICLKLDQRYTVSEHPKAIHTDESDCGEVGVVQRGLQWERASGDACDWRGDRIKRREKQECERERGTAD
ncbi:hypothetical protein DPX16_9003 [Anabarilius grahami]|uniref:Sleeping Beauty transposase HTH domain-containing protein n=1 Tax=Anabarilius grahami TaxID=495550 RepID=A0A3N0XCW6_ANAGA|nr:hypothetical protein DPX16_9003 [Anabarilius grahami]